MLFVNIAFRVHYDRKLPVVKNVGLGLFSIPKLKKWGLMYIIDECTT